ncbi:MAG: response regulator transcription factor [Bryobacteraceae bacterium]|nr:response regulator transcription factor [Bryobacteraceae bacterium]
MKVLLADDHPLSLDGLKDLLEANGYEVEGLAHDGLEAVEKARDLHPDVLLMDIRMPRLDGLAALRVIKAELPEIQVIMLTVSEADDDLFEAIKSGASGYLLKSQSAEELLTLMRGVERGEAAFSPGLAARILQEFGRQASALEEKHRTAALSEREREVLTLVAQGLKYKEVAAKLFLSERTVKYHMGRILERLHLKNRAQVIEYARRTGLAG